MFELQIYKKEGYIEFVPCSCNFRYYSPSLFQICKIMRKLFTVIAILAAALFVSCKKDKVETKKELNVNVTSIAVAESFQMYVKTAEGFIPVIIEPKEAKLTKHVSVSIEPDDVVSYSVSDEGISIKPKKIGEATITLTPKYGENLSEKAAQCKISVTENPSEPASISILTNDTDHWFSDHFELAEGEDYQFKAVVLNKAGAVTADYQIIWNAMIYTYGDIDGFEFSPDGVLSKSKMKGGNIAELYVTAYVKDYEKEKVSSGVDVQILPVPTQISLSFSGTYTPNSDGELFIKKGLRAASFSVVTVPSTAVKAFDIKSSDESLVLALINKSSGGVYTGAKSSSTPVTVTVSSRHNKDANASCKVYVSDYDATEVKPGDYVYSNGSKIEYRDCGYRLPGIYQAADGSKGTVPVFPGRNISSYSYIGVVAQTGLPNDDDFLGCSYLSQCLDGASASGLYENNAFRKNHLGGFANAVSQHALVISYGSPSVGKKWQEKTENIAMTYATKSGLYQSQLSRKLVFSAEAKTYYNNYTVQEGHYEGQTWVPDYDSHGNYIYTHPYNVDYCESGFIAHLLMKFYTAHLNNNSYSVIPVSAIEGLTSAPGFSASNGTTGWFLPGRLEWSVIGDNLGVINNSLSQKNAGSKLESTYWSTEEDRDKVYTYTIGSSVSRKEADKTSTGDTRAVLWL